MAMAVRRGRFKEAPSSAFLALRRITFRGDRLATKASHVRARLLFMILDILAVAAGYGVAEVAYLRDRPPAEYWQHFFLFLILALVVHLGANWVFGLYGRIWRYAGIEEARQVILSAATALLVIAAMRPVWRMIDLERIPLRVVFVGCAFVTMAMGGLRFHSRLFAWQRGTRLVGLRVAIIGSRDAGAEAIREMRRTPVAGLVPVAVFDDDGHRHGLSLIGVPVVGGIEDIPAAASRYTIQQVLLAIPNPSPELVERALHASEVAGISMRILPSVKDVLGGEAAFDTHPPSPRAAHRGPPRPHDGEHRPRRGSPVPGRPTRPRHRRGWLDRLRDRPSGRRIQPRTDPAARPRRDPSSRHRRRPARFH